MFLRRNSKYREGGRVREKCLTYKNIIDSIFAHSYKCVCACSCMATSYHFSESERETNIDNPNEIISVCKLLNVYIKKKFFL